MGVAQASRDASTNNDMASQLYAVIEAGGGALNRLSAALDAADLASALIVPADGVSLEAGLAKPLIAAAQKAGAAALIAGDAELARALGADGVHVSATKDLAGAYALARGTLGQRGIVGVDVGISRHDAMTLAEAGADYIAFGAPTRLKDRAKARARRDELVAWWAEIFEVACVALDVESPEEAAALANAGADFIGLRLGAAMTPSATRQFLADVAATLGETADAD
jgi:thiamine-phosphate pyrophosphorylase